MLFLVKTLVKPLRIKTRKNHEFLSSHLAVVAEWSKTHVEIQVAISPLQTQVQISLGTI